MLLHTVHFWLKDEVTDSQKNEFLKGIQTFIDAVDEIERAEYGTPANTTEREVVDLSFGVSLFVLFKSLEDHDTYQSHPAHDVFIDSFKDLWEKVQVRDSNLVSA